jgi:hypothetical protein
VELLVNQPNALLHVATRTAAGAGQIHAEDFYLPVSGLDITFETAEQCTLPSAAWPDDGHTFAARDVQRFEREDRPVFSVANFDVLEPNHADAQVYS